MDRPIRVALITVDKGNAAIELIRLESARPGSEVLDRTAIEAAKERARSMIIFTELLKAVERPYNRSYMEYMADIAKAKNIAQEIVDEAAQLISQAQERLAKENGKK
jgi:hypothetical protein